MHGHIGLDKDKPEAFEGLTLPDTTRWETRPGRYGLSFIATDVAALLEVGGREPDLAQFYLFKNGERIGEIKLHRSYQVIPDSWKLLEDNTKAYYKLIDALPPAVISLRWLIDELMRLGITLREKDTNEEKTKLEANTERLEEIKKEVVDRAQDKTAKAKEFLADAILEGSKPESRNVKGFWLACQLRDLGLDAGAGSEYMRDYARAMPEGDHPYTEEDAQKSLEQAYSRAPREPPKSEAQRQEETSGDKLTIDMFTKVTGREKIIDPVTGKPAIDPKTGENEKPKLTLSASKAANTITDKFVLGISDKDTSDKAKIWSYNGIWKPDGERKIVSTIDAVLEDLSYEKGLRETLRRIRNRIPVVSFDSNPYLFPAKDGVIELETGIFRPAKPNDYLTFQYNVNINEPDADYKPFLWFLCSSLPDPGDVLTVLDIITAIAIRVPFEVIVLLFGGGSNGKGILEKVILALYTMQRTTAIRLEEMKRSRFGPGALFNKEVWIVTEVETVNDAMSILKAEASGEFFDSDIKYGERVSGKPHAVSILDANNAFEIKDNTYGWKRRFVKIDFPYTFGYDEGMRPKDSRLEEKLTRPEVLAGIAQIIRARAPSLVRSRRIYRRKSTEEQEDEFRRQQFHLNTFCEDCLSTIWPYDTKEYGNIPSEKLRVDVVYAEYLKYCQLFNVTDPASKVEFGRYISKKFDKTSAHTTEKDTSFRYYPGLYQIREAKTLYVEVKESFKDIKDRSRTDQGQMWCIEKNNSRPDRTDRTDKTLIKVTRKIEEMFEFIKGSKNPSEISFENFLAQRSVLSVLPPDNAGDVSRNSQGQIEKKSVLDLSPEDKPSVLKDGFVLNPGEPLNILPRGEDDRPKTGKIDRPTPVRKTPKVQRSPEMETFKRILAGIKEPFTFERLCNICESAGLPPSQYKTWIQEEMDQGRIVGNNGSYEIKEVSQ